MEKGENQNQKGFTTTTPPFKLRKRDSKGIYYVVAHIYANTCSLSSI
jgi:hypothetical protein